MTTELTLAGIPLVLEADEVPFVLGFSLDPRPCLEFGGAQYRRGVDRAIISWKFDAVSLRALVINADDATYLFASASSILNDWWPVLQREGGNPARPLLSSGVTGLGQTFKSDKLSVDISIVPPGPGADMTAAVTGIGRADGLTDTALLMTQSLSLATIKAALLVLAEYGTLLDPVPDVDVSTGGAQVPLSTVLEVARETSAAIAWIRAA